MKLSANLGFLFRELPLLDAARAAKTAGFGAAELHWPYATDPAALRTTLAELGLPLLALNTELGDRQKGDFGLCAIPGREAEARAVIDQAVDYAAAAGAGQIHIMSGKARGDEARATLIGNLHYAADRIAGRDIGLLIEPLNHRDAPGYFLRTLDQALDIVEAAQLPRLRIMYDCYHMQIEGGDLLTRLRNHLPLIGHVQIAAVPDRGEPDRGEVDFDWLLPQMIEAGYTGWVGAEYRPRGDTTAGLGWMKALQ